MCCTGREPLATVSMDLGAATIPDHIRQLKALTRSAKEATRALTALKEAQEATEASTASDVAKGAQNGKREQLTQSGRPNVHSAPNSDGVR